MSVYVKSKKSKGFCIPVPSMLARLVPRPSLGDFIKRKSLEKADEKSKAYIEALDFRTLFGSVGSLFEYKGLTLVEVSDKEGNEVKITI